MKRPIKDRFEKFIFYSTDGCWYWLGYLDKKGYGRVTQNGVHVLAHRFSYQINKGDPGSLFVCHHCDNPACVNPDHLFLGTPKDNMQDMHRKGRYKHPYKTMTACKKNHPYTEENTFFRIRNGKRVRVCRRCRNDDTKKWLLKLKTAS